MTDDDRATLKRIEEKLDLILARTPELIEGELIEGELVTSEPPYRIAAAVEAMHERNRKARR